MPILTELWRRPLRIKRANMLALFETLHQGTATTAAQAVLAAGLLAPDFIYRVETVTGSGKPAVSVE